MSYTITGKVIQIGNTESVGANGFQKRQIVIETAGQYPQQIAFELTKDKCSLADLYKVGQQVEVGFDLRGREYNGKYYTNLTAWKLNAASQDEPGAPF